ncbi:hypothetical protein TSUD_119590 [Trifolium subterraneum]|uniref:F-box domain-containing protein n=1 Tax=Trifolium subterraneum TaxID=3900 RepID=A0A2Z6N0B5_TRISU|nr:hypothetical protein TSUD_119590 [Trifolium subterraneum]
MMSPRRSIPTADRISDLPDSILCHILSFLPTNYAATTSILSKRWKSVWLSVLSLNFDYLASKDFKSFRKSVFATMSTLKNKDISIHSFTIKSGQSSKFISRDYIRICKFVMERGIKNLYYDMSEKGRFTKLPLSILGLKTLQVLKLTEVKMGEFNQVDFPCVKTLHLNRVRFICEEYIEKFLFGFPILEDLQLLSLGIEHYVRSTKNLRALPSFVKVRMVGSNTPMTLVCTTKILHMEKLYRMNWRELPMFHNLIQLELSIDNETFYGNCRSLLEILPHFPKLQHFSIQDRMGALSKCLDCWNDPPIVAECLSLQLKTFCIRGYRASEPTAPALVVTSVVRSYAVEDHVLHIDRESRKVEKLISWKPPPVGWVRLNTDGARSEDGSIGCGGIIRGSDSEWLGGFAKFVGFGSAYLAQLWGVFEGLTYARNLNLSHVELNVNSMVVVQAITTNGCGSMTQTERSLVKKIRRLLALDWEVSVKHSYREANQCANALANRRCCMNIECVFFDVCPNDIRHFLVADVLGIAIPRLVSV